MDNLFNETINLLNNIISPAFRSNIEKKYYEKINANARINTALKDPLFLDSPLEHISFSNDHGVVHVRDIAVRTLSLIEQLNGIHFPKRHPARLEFMKGLGVILAYIHDIGMANITNMLEDMHTQITAQTIYQPSFEEQLNLLWEENSGNVAWRITKLVYQKVLPHNSKNILREILAISGLHAKEACPGELFNQPQEMRRLLQEMIAFPLTYQTLQEQYLSAEKQLHAAVGHTDSTQRKKYEDQKHQAEEALAKYGQPQINDFLKIYYADFWKESFQWLISDNELVCELRDDVIDTLRVLRAANANRQRGAKLRSTGEHQIFLDHHSANAVYAVNTNQKLFLLESRDILLAGEVNLSSTEFTQAGDLRISFYRGQFADEEATKRAIFNAAIAINVVQEDMLGSFQHKSGADFRKQFEISYILLENCDDNPDFSTFAKEQLILLNPQLKETISVVPSLQNATEQERNRYLSTTELKLDLKTENDMLENIANSGHKIISMKAQDAFKHVKCVDIPAGEVLVQAGSPASFVYIPLNEGLTGYPLGGYAPFHVNAYIPLGHVGVIRGDTRNSTIIAEHAVKVLMVPKEVYLKYWHNAYTEAEFIHQLKALTDMTA